MKIIVPLKQVPDLVEDLEVDGSGTQLDFEELKMKLNEFDDHALEEALLLKEDCGADVVALAVEGAETDRMLFTALAKGADEAVKIAGADPNAGNAVLGHVFAEAARQLGGDLILTGVQSAGDRDGQLGPIMAARMGIPAVSVVTGVTVAGNTAALKKEYSGGIMAGFEVEMPAVLGIQAARQAPATRRSPRCARSSKAPPSPRSPPPAGAETSRAERRWQSWHLLPKERAPKCWAARRNWWKSSSKRGWNWWKCPATGKIRFVAVPAAEGYG